MKKYLWLVHYEMPMLESEFKVITADKNIKQVVESAKSFFEINNLDYSESDIVYIEFVEEVYE